MYHTKQYITGHWGTITTDVCTNLLQASNGHLVLHTPVLTMADQLIVHLP